MKSINNNSSEIIINKSRFICELIYVNNIDEINENLDIIKNKYKNATHYCFAYICSNQKRMNDNGEPSGTAGLPILNVLESNNLNNVLCVVIRYFGGIKLGTGGLFRAYSKAVINALENTNIIDITKGTKFLISFNYDSVKKIDNIVKKYIVNKTFDDLISYELDIPIEIENLIINSIKPDVTSIKRLNSIYIKKNP